jgi:hypothetical protein
LARHPVRDPHSAYSQHVRPNNSMQRTVLLIVRRKNSPADRDAATRR